jgi:uncharacterized iron-regulated membrane protein
MITVRKTFFWLHLIAGAVAGLVVLTMSVTGVLLTYERQILARADRGYEIRQPAGAARLAPSEVIAKEAAAARGYPATITIRAAASEPVQLGYGQDSVYVNPYTGAILGEGSTKAREFFRVVRNWHRWLAAEGESRETARTVTGASNLAFLFLVASGFYLLWPRQWTKQHLRAISWFRVGLSGRGRDFNWHNVIGLWCAPPLFIIVLGGVVISYPWASNLVYELTGSPAPATKGGKKGGIAGKKGGGRPARNAGGGGNAPGSGAPDYSAMDRYFSQAQTKVPGWQSINLRIPETDRAALVFTIDSGDGGQPQKRSTLTLDQRTGETREWTTFADGSSGQRLRSWLRFTHTGEYYGIVGQTVAGVASAGATVLVWTGIAMALRRFDSWRKRRRVRQNLAEEPAIARVGGME